MGVGEQGAIATPVGVKRAIAYMRAHLAERIVLADLARAGGVSERALTRQFRTFLGKSPMNYLQQLRLAACRDRLLRPATGNSVTAAATEMGFTHFGRFADCYRRAFGETPSVTARRAAAAEQDAAPAVPHRHTPELVVLPLRSGTGEEARWAEHMLECLLARLSPTR